MSRQELVRLRLRLAGIEAGDDRADDIDAGTLRENALQNRDLLIVCRQPRNPIDDEHVPRVTHLIEQPFRAEIAVQRSVHRDVDGLLVSGLTLNADDGDPRLGRLVDDTVQRRRRSKGGKKDVDVLLDQRSHLLDLRRNVVRRVGIGGDDLAD